MIVSWMIYTLFVGTLIAIAARAVERVGRLASYPARWVWAGAMLLTIGLAARAALEPPTQPASAPFASTTTIDLPNVSASTGWQHAIGEATRRLVDVALDVPSRLQAGVSVHVPLLAIVAVWVACSVALGIVLLVVHAKFRSSRRRWPETTLHGVPVRVSAETGPVVLGVLRPDVVIPQWLLEHDEVEQRLVIAHEAEHVRARDPLLLGAASIAMLLAPWHAALWYMLSRLRLAIEVDCDARVLKGGTSRSMYGALLIDVAERASPLRPHALALADDSSHLSQRILAMSARLPRFAVARATAAALIGCVAILTACEARMPTQTAPQKSSTNEAAQQLARVKDIDTTEHFVVDGVPVTPEQVRALNPNRVSSVDVKKSGGHDYVDIKLKPNGDSTPPRRKGDPNGDPVTLAVKTASGFPVSSDSIVFIIDGKRSTAEALNAIDRSMIESIEVVKGPTAVQLYGTGARGFIVVTTKGAKRPPHE